MFQSVPLCSGKVSRDDPAAQALDWGVRVAEAKEGESGFWRAMTAAEVYRDAGLSNGLEDAESREILDEVVSQGLDMNIESDDRLLIDDGPPQVHDGIGGEAASQAWAIPPHPFLPDYKEWSDSELREVVEEWWADVGRWWKIYREKLEDIDLTPYTQKVQGDEGGTRSDPWPGPRLCGVELFLYPVWWRPYPAGGGKSASTAFGLRLCSSTATDHPVCMTARAASLGSSDSLRRPLLRG